MPMSSTHTVLILERDPDLMDRLIEQLIAEGLSIEVCVSAASALSRLQKDAIDLVVAGFELSDMDGLDFLGRCGNVPVVFSGEPANHQRLVDALEQGAVDFLARPFDLREVVARVRRRLDCVSLQQRLNAT